MRARGFVCFVALCGVATLPSPASAAKLKIVNGDAAGEGFNDPTPATPVGGNKGNTVGEQRLIAFQYAANLWGATLPDSGDFQIRVFSRFDPLTCTASSAVLGSAGAITVASDFPGAAFPATWYGSALANHLAGYDLLPGPKVVPGVDPTSLAARMFDDINARFNSSIGGTNPDGSPCLTGAFWYYGLDTNTPAGGINLVTVLLHEFAHGLGFQSFVNVSTGTELLGMDDIYEKSLQDTTTGKHWDVMSDAERMASATNFRRVIWTGPGVTAAVPAVLSAGTPSLTVNSPGGIAGVYPVGTAGFGPALSSPGVTADVVLANDGVAPGSDACQPLPAGSLAGAIALIDRGTCTFESKSLRAQQAGAVAVVLVNNVAGSPPGLGDDTTIPPGAVTIPTVSISLADGNAIKAALASGPVNATVGTNPAVRAGADPGGRALVYTPGPVQPGSSVSHWDTIATPNQLMEPAINSDLTHSLVPPQDLTFELLQDIGW